MEDNPADRDLILHELGKGEFDVISDVVQTAEEFRQRIKTNIPDVVLADYNLGQWRGMEALEILRAEGLDIPLILVSGAMGAVTAVECIKQGVTDYVLKDSLPRLSVALRGALKDKEARQERNRNQQALARKVEELARSNADLEQFAYVASHDLQEPLRMVSAYTQLLAERYRGKLDEQADKYISYAVDGAARMQSLIQDLLAFSRVGRQETALKITDCNEIVGQAMRDLQAAILESRASVTHGSLPRADGQRYPTQAGVPEPNRKWPEISALRTSRHSHLRAEESRATGYSPWPTMASASRRSTPKTSSSFSTACTPARNIRATASGWRSARKLSNATAARFRRSLNDGRRHHLQIHLARGKTRRRRGPRMMAGTAEILLVDDNPADLDLTIDALAQSSWPSHVNTVSDGAEAIAYLRREGKYSTAARPHLVLLDLNLPRKDGRSVLADVKTDPSLRRIPVVIFSTSQAAKDIERSYELGANSYVSKPPTLGEWVSAVKLMKDFWIGCACLPREEQQ